MKSLADCEVDRARAQAEFDRAAVLLSVSGLRAAQERIDQANREIEAVLAGEEP